jgi:hypothetical protein
MTPPHGRVVTILERWFLKALTGQIYCKPVYRPSGIRGCSTLVRLCSANRSSLSALAIMLNPSSVLEINAFELSRWVIEWLMSLLIQRMAFVPMRST